MKKLIKKTNCISRIEMLGNKCISPFASREDEQIVYMPPSSKSCFISVYNITELQKIILRIIDENIFITSKLIISQLAGTGYDEKLIKKELGRLYDGGYIHKIGFESDLGRSSYRVYFLSYKRGGILFKSVFGRYPKLVSYAESITDPSMIKKYLAVNQFISNIENAEPCLYRGQVVEKKVLFSKFPVRILGCFKNNERVFFCEVIRRSDDLKIMLEKHSRLSKLISSPKNITPEINGVDLNLIIICEDELHAEEMEKLLHRTYRGRNVTFTYDMEILNSSPYLELNKVS